MHECLCSGSDTEVVIMHKSKVEEKSKMKLAVGSFILTLKEKFKLTDIIALYSNLEKLLNNADVFHEVS